MSRRSLYMLSGVSLALILGLFWFFLLSPIRGQISETEAQIETEQQALATAQAKLAQLEQYRVQAKKNESRMLELAKMIPLEDELPSLILQIQNLAAESGIDFLTIAPAGLSPGAPGASPGSFEVVTLTLNLKGRFFDINDFIYRAEQLAGGPGRLLRVASVTLGGGGGKANVSPKLEATVVLNAYTRVAAPPAPPAAAPVQSEPVASPQPAEVTEASPTNWAG